MGTVSEPALSAAHATAGGGAPPAAMLLVLLQLARRARGAESPEALGFVMVNETRQLLPYRQAAWFSGGAFARVAAVSGLPQPAPTAPYTQWLGRLQHELRRRRDNAVVVLQPADLPADLATDGAEWLPPYWMWMPLSLGDGGDLGEGSGLLLAGDAPWTDTERVLAGELADTYAHALRRLAPRRGFTRLWQRRGWRVVLPWLVLAGLAAAAFMPVRLSVLAPAEVVPFEPFLVRAPQDGVIDQFLVQPNQPVQRGDVLLRLDTTSLQARNAVARKAYDTALEEYRQAAQLAVSDPKGKLDLATRRGALEQKAVELAYTQQQLGRVRIQAERGGVAVFADVNDWLGKAVVAGEKILTLADPGAVELAVELPVHEAIALEPEAEVRLYPNGDALQTYAARVAQFAYHAEPLADGRVVYRVKARFAAEAGLPRIGQKGTARLYGERVTLAYYLARRPLTALRQWVGW